MTNSAINIGARLESEWARAIGSRRSVTVLTIGSHSLFTETNQWTSHACFLAFRRKGWLTQRARKSVPVYDVTRSQWGE